MFYEILNNHNNKLLQIFVIMLGFKLQSSNIFIKVFIYVYIFKYFSSKRVKIL